MQIDRRKFRRFPLGLRYKIVEQHGDYIGCRKHLSFNIELFQLKNFYVEVWRSIAINQIQWIECPAEDYVLSNYVKPSLLEDILK